MTVSFGSPAPLPGQPGFRATTSEVMQRETAEMEERLAKLNDELSAEAEAREAAGSKVGGSRWRSARVDRGSVRAYANDVKFRHRYRLQQRPPHGIFASRGEAGTSGGIGGAGLGIEHQAGAGARAAAALRERDAQQQYRRRRKALSERSAKDTTVGLRRLPQTEKQSCSEQNPSGFTEKQVSLWSVVHTLEWLDSLGLGRYRGVFQQNEISGPILLEVGLDDLDYMKVHVLAHRKHILKGIEELRRGAGGDGNGVDIPPPAPAQRSNGVGRVGGGVNERRANESSAENSGGRSPMKHDGHQRHSATGKVKRQHWSQLKPLSDNQVEDIDRAGPSNKLADGEYDEQVAHSSFVEAVAAWRGQQGTSISPPSSSPSKCSAATTVTRAPVYAALEPEPHQLLGKEPSITGQLGVDQLGSTGLLGVSRGGGRTDCWVNPFASLPGSDEEHEISSITEQGKRYQEPEEPEVFFVSPPRRLRATRSDTKARTMTPTAAEIAIGGDTPRMDSEILNEGADWDESAEHAAFRRAVADWNNGGGRGGDRGSITARTERHESKSTSSLMMVDGATGAAQAPTAAVGVKTPQRAAEALVGALRDQMDAEHRDLTQKMQERKRALLQGLADDDCKEGSMDHGPSRSRCVQNRCADDVDNRRGRNSVETSLNMWAQGEGWASHLGGGGSGELDERGWSGFHVEGKQGDGSDDDVSVPPRSTRDGTSSQGEDPGKEMGWEMQGDGVEIEFVESVLGTREDLIDCGDSAEYIVEENDSVGNSKHK